MISFMAINLYYDPRNLAGIATNHYFWSKGIAANPDSEEYKTHYDEILEIASNDPNLVINEFDLRNFCASPSWVSNFMKSHNFVFRKTYARKRGELSQESVQKYIDELLEAIKKYGPDKILNMDETQILLDNSDDYTITHKGEQDVYINKDFKDEKCGTTYIATISLNPAKRYPLILIAKGTSTGCENKYGNVDNVLKTHSLNGWTTPQNMIDYLNLVHEWIPEPCALVLDLFASHHCQAVKDRAQELGIDLIFVPANGTGLYQPLDRKIFGILKKQLSSLERSNPIKVEKHIKKYQIVNERVGNIFKKISEKAIISSWDFDNVISISQGEENDTSL